MSKTGKYFSVIKISFIQSLGVVLLLSTKFSVLSFVSSVNCFVSGQQPVKSTLAVVAAKIVLFTLFIKIIFKNIKF